MSIHYFFLRKQETQLPQRNSASVTISSESATYMCVRYTWPMKFSNNTITYPQYVFQGHLCVFAVIWKPLRAFIIICSRLYCSTRPHISRHLRNGAASNEEVPILVAPQQFVAPSAIINPGNPGEKSCKPHMLRNYSSFSTMLSLIVKAHLYSVTHTWSAPKVNITYVNVGLISETSEAITTEELQIRRF